MGVRLPSAYQEVEYLQSDGYQYFYSDIDIQDGLTVDSVQSYNATGDMYLFGGNMANGRSTFNGGYSRQIEAGYPSGYYLTGSGLDKTNNTVYHIVTTHANGTITVYLDGNLVKNTSGLASIEADGSKCAVFGNRPAAGGEPNYKYKGRVYSLKVSKNGTILADYVPCYRKSDSEPGMYDLVYGTFFTNQGTGEFLVGPDVIDSISPWLVARRRMLMYKEPELYPVGTDIVLEYIGLRESSTWQGNFGFGNIKSDGSFEEVTGDGGSPVFMPVNPKYRYRKTGRSGHNGRIIILAFYDRNKSFISAVSYNNLTEMDLSPFPANAAYARLQTHSSTNNWGIAIVRIS